MAKLQPDYIKWVATLDASQAQREFSKLDKASKDLKSSANATRKAMAELEAQGKKGSDEWKNLKKSLAGYNQEISLNTRQMEEVTKRFGTSSMTVAQLRKQLKSLTREFETTSKAANPRRYNELQQQIREMREALDKTESSLKSLEKGFFSFDKIAEIIKGSLWAIGSTLLNQVVGAFKNLIGTVQDFSAANSKLAAILGTSKEGIKDLKEQSLELGRTTSFTASAVMQLQTELAKLGFTQQQILSMTPAVLKFAKAVDTDLGSAAAFAGAALRIFDKEASDTESVLATLAISTSRSALDFSKLQASLSTIGPVAASFGLTLEDTVALLGVLSNAGFDASSAATAMRNIILNLCDDSGKLATALGHPARNLDEIVAGMRKLSDEGVDLGKVLEMTDKRSVAAFSTILAGTDGVLALRDQITGATDDFRQMADTMADNSKAAEAGMYSAIEGLLLRFGGLDSILAKVYSAMTGLITIVGTVVDIFKPCISVIGKFCMSVLNAVEAVFALIGKITKLGESFSGWSRWLLPLWKQLETLTTVLGWVTSGIDKLTGILPGASKKVAELTEAQKRHNDASEQASKNISAETNKIETLVRTARNELLARQQRLAAMQQLNAIIPGYNGQLDAETGRYVENTKALNGYLKSLREKIRLEAYAEEYRELVKADAVARRNLYGRYTAQMDAEQKFFGNGGTPDGPLAVTDYTGGAASKPQRQMTFEEWYKDQGTESGRNLELFEAQMRIMGVSIDKFTTSVADSAKTTVTETMAVAADSADKAKTRATRISAEINAALQRSETEHAQRMAQIKKTEEEMTGPQYAKALAEETRTHAQASIAALDELAASVDKSNTQMLDAIAQKRAGFEAQDAKALADYNAAVVSEEKTAHDSRLKAWTIFYDAMESVITDSVTAGTKSESVAAIERLQNQKGLHEMQLKEMEAYLAKVQTMEAMSAEERTKTMATLKDKIASLRSDILNDTGKLAETINALLRNDNSFDGIIKSIDQRRAETEQLYDAALSVAGLTADQIVALEAAKNRALAQLDAERGDKIYEMAARFGVTWGDEYANELRKLKEMHSQGLVSEKQYQRERLKLQTKNVAKYFDFYAGLASQTVEAAQSAEIAAVDAKYDVLIQQAQNNGEDTAALEEEKENKKLEIQKKYADVDFAVKISQIIADTAVSAMKTYAQFGWPWGIVPAAMVTATGVAQMAIAKAERDKIKNMQPGSSAASGSSASSAKPTAVRQLSGYSEGGYTGDGDRYEVAGVVHRGEYVVPKPIMHHPYVVDAVGAIEAIRRNRLPAATQPANGFSDGGYTDDPVRLMHTAKETISLTNAVDKLASAARSLRNIRANVVYRDITRAGETLSRAKAPFTRNR